MSLRASVRTSMLDDSAVTSITFKVFFMYNANVFKKNVARVNYIMVNTR